MSDGNKFSLIDFDGASDIVIKLLDMIEKAVGWIIIPRGTKADFKEGLAIYKESIMNDNTLSGIEKGARISTAQKELKQYINQGRIISYATKDIKDDAKMNIDDDWLMYFFDHAKNITNEELQEIWGKVLAGEINEPNTYTKQFLHVMSIMDSEIAKSFQKIRKCCFTLSSKPYMFIYNRSYDDGIDNGRLYGQININYNDIKELDNIGIVQYRHSNFFTIRSDYVEVCYGNKKIELKTDNNKIVTGNVSLTNIGEQLCKIVTPEYDESILDICLDIWKSFGYNPIVKDSN